MQLFQQSEGTAAQRRLFFHAVDATDGLTPETGLTGVGRISKNGAATAATSASITEIDSTNMPGRYYIEFTAAEVDTLADIEFRFKAAACAEVVARGQVVPWDPYDAVRMGLTALPNAVAEAAGGLYTRGTGAGQINQPANGRIDGNVVAMAANVLTATAIAANAFIATKFAANSLDGKGDWNIGKTGYSLAATGLDAIVSTATGMVEIAKAIWNRVLNGVNHNIPNSGGRRLRTLQEFLGYELGSIWIDTVNGTAGAVAFENGTAGNPVNNLADAITLAAAVGLIRFVVANGSSITFAEAHTNEVWAGLGRGWDLALGGQDISGTHILGAGVSGTATTPAGKAHVEDSEISTATLGLCHLIRCSLDGTITLSAAAAYLFDDCTSEGTTGAIIDTGVAVLNLHLDLHRFSGELELQNVGQAGADTIHVFGSGELTINANCVAGGTIEVRGPWEVVDNGTSTVNLDDLANNVVSVLADTGTDGVVVAAASKNGYALSAAGNRAVMTEQMTEGYAADGVVPTPEQALMGILQQAGEFAISGTTITVKKLDGSATAMTFTLDSATDPTSRTRAT